MGTDKEDNKKKQKIRYKAKTILVFLLLCIAFMYGMISPPMLLHVWFPFAMAKAGLEGSAGHISYSPWIGNGKFYIENLKCSDPRTGFSISVEHLEARLDFYSLMCGDVQVDSVFLRNASLKSTVPSDPAVLKQWGPLLPMFLKERTIQRVTFRAVTFTGLTPGVEQRFCSYGTLHLKGGGKLPVHSEVHFSLNDQWQLQQFLGNVTVSGGEGAYDGYALDQTDASAMITSKLTPENRYIWEANLQLHRFDVADEIRMNGSGIMSADGKEGNANWNFFGKFASPTIDSGSMRWMEGCEYEPQELELSAKDLKVTWDAKKIAWKVNADANWERIYMRGEEMLKKGYMKFVHAGHIEFPSGSIHFEEASLNAAAEDSFFKISESGEYTMTRNISGIWQIQGNQTKDAFLRIQGGNIPAKLLNPLLPFDFSGGDLSGNWITTMDWEKGQVYMSIELAADDVGVCEAEKTGKDRQIDFRLTTDLHSDGLLNIRELNVDRLNFACSENGKKLSTVNMKGAYTFLDHGLTLNGNMEFIPYVALKPMPLRLPRYLSRKLEEAHGEELESRYSLQIKYAPKVSPVVYFQAQSSSDPLPLICKEWNENPIYLRFNGTVQKTQPEKTVFAIEHLTLGAKDLCLLEGNLSTTLPANETSAKLELKQFSPVLLTRLLEFFAFPDKTKEPYVIPQLKYDRITASVNIETIPGESVKLSGFDLHLYPDSVGFFHLRQKDSLTYDLNNPTEVKGLFHLSAQDVPFTWFNCFVKPGFPFHFCKGIGSMDATVTMNNLSDIRLEPHINGSDFGISLYNTDYLIETGKVDCTLSFHNLLRQMVFHDLYFSCMRDKKEFAGFTTKGVLNFEFKDPQVRSQLDFNFRHMSPVFLMVLFGEEMQNWPQKNFAGDGNIRYEGWNCFDSNDFSGRIAIRNWEVEQEDEYTPLHGEFDFRVQDRIGLWGFQNTSLQLRNDKDHIIFDLFLDGVMQLVKEKPSHYRILSSGMNVPFIYDVLVKAGKIKKTENHIKKGSVWPFDEEPDLSSWCGKQTDVELDIKNWILTPWQVLSIKGRITRTAGILTTKNMDIKLNDSQIQMNLDADFANKTGLIFNFDLYAPTLNVTDILHIGDVKKLSEGQDDISIKKEGKAFSGTLENTSLKISGKGISLDNLDRNFQFTSVGDVRNLSIPFSAKDSFWLLRVILLPLEVLPKTVNMLPDSPLRRFFSSVIGDTIPVLTGQANIEFDRGHIDMFSHRSDIHIRNMYFIGPKFKTRIEQGHINPFYNKMDIYSVMSIDRTNYPIHIYGKLTDPSVYFLSELPKFLYDNTLSLDSKTVHYLTLGLIDEDEDLWTRPAKIQFSEEEGSKEK